MRSKGLFLLSLLFLGFVSNAQLETDADFKRTVYKNEFTAGVMFHSRGYGLNVRRMYYRTGYRKAGFEIDMVNIRHPKEVKYPNRNFLNTTQNFVYGKLNSLFSIRTGFTSERILIDKTDQGTISINWLVSGGASFGLLKPVYLQILSDDGGTPRLLTERYDPAVHDYQEIYGQAPFFTGISETKLVPGAYLKSGLSFDYNFLDDKVATLEVGGLVDYFFGEVPIMHDTKNYQIWWQIYLTFNIGTKWN